MKNNSGGRNLTHQVTRRLGLAIVKGAYSTDKSLPTEAQLAEEFDISRSVMREAVKMLTAKGLIVSRPRQGIRQLPTSEWNMFDSDVLDWILNSSPSLEQLLQFTQFRAAIEPEAAALAALCSDQSKKEPIMVALERMKAAEEGKDDSLEADIAFHTSILHASGNVFFMQLSDFIETALRVSITYTNRIKNVKFASYDDHRDLAVSILDSDPESARKASKFLLDEALELISSSLVDA